MPSDETAIQVPADVIDSAIEARGTPRVIEALKETARRISRQLQKSGATGAA